MSSENNSIRDITEVRDANFRLLHLFSLYLNERPEFITADMVREVAGVGEFGEEEAFLLLFSEACGVHPLDDETDELFFRDFFAPSIRRLEPARYRSDPYYRNIRFPEAKDGDWELRNDCFKAFRPFIRDDVRPDDRLRELPPLSYFSEDFTYPVVLEKGREWMLVTPNEIETIRPAAEAARGRVVTFGLGLGYFPYMASEKKNVEKITIVEKDPAVIRLFRQYILPQFSHPEKIELINEDAFAILDQSMKPGQFDFAYADIWHDAGDGIPLYLRFNKYEEHFPETEFQYWIEDTMLSYLRWHDFGRMPEEVRDPYRWLNNENTKRRARELTAEQWCEDL